MSESESAPPALLRVDILGAKVTVSSPEGVQRQLAALVASRGGYVSCANAYSLSRAKDDPDYRRVLNDAAILTTDGMPVVWTLRLLGYRAERVHNDDLLGACCTRFAKWRHFLVGGRAGQPDLVAAAMKRRFPGIDVVGTHATPVRPVPQPETDAIVAKVTRAAPDIVWVGMGTPAQDIWMSSVVGRIPAPMVGVGSVFDVLAERARPTPEWMKRTGLQWLYRFAQEPRRLASRYTYHNARFCLGVALLLTSGRGRR